jgi:hypothetical protein
MNCINGNAHDLICGSTTPGTSFSLYKTRGGREWMSTISSRTFQHKGCYESSCWNAGGIEKPQYNFAATVSGCAEACNGYTHFGFFNGYVACSVSHLLFRNTCISIQCICRNPSPQNCATSTSCNKACISDETAYSECGGADSTSVYELVTALSTTSARSLLSKNSNGVHLVNPKIQFVSLRSLFGIATVI